MSTLKIKMKEVMNKYKFIKFLFVGGSSTLLDFFIYLSLSNFIAISLSKCFSMIVSCTYSFFLNKSWTFNDKQKINTKQIISYIIVQVINIVTNVTINQMGYIITNNKLLAYIVATGISMIVNYLLQKNIIFKENLKK